MVGGCGYEMAKVLLWQVMTESEDSIPVKMEEEA